MALIICWNRARGTMTSAIWNLIALPWGTIFAPIFTSRSRSAMSDAAPAKWQRCRSAAGRASPKDRFPPKAAVAGSLAPNRWTRPFSDIQARLPNGRCWPNPERRLWSAQLQQADVRPWKSSTAPKWQCSGMPQSLGLTVRNLASCNTLQPATCLACRRSGSSSRCPFASSGDRDDDFAHCPGWRRKGVTHAHGSPTVVARLIKQRASWEADMGTARPASGGCTRILRRDVLALVASWGDWQWCTHGAGGRCGGAAGAWRAHLARPDLVRPRRDAGYNHPVCTALNAVGPRVGEWSFGRIAGFPYTAPYEELTPKGS
jgi:hypothetical protein